MTGETKLNKGAIDIKRAVSCNNVVQFQFYRNGELFYKTAYDEIFTIPVYDAQEVGEATFNATDKAILFMRYMRKWNEALK